MFFFSFSRWAIESAIIIKKINMKHSKLVISILIAKEKNKRDPRPIVSTFSHDSLQIQLNGMVDGIFKSLMECLRGKLILIWWFPHQNGQPNWNFYRNLINFISSLFFFFQFFNLKKKQAYLSCAWLSCNMDFNSRRLIHWINLIKMKFLCRLRDEQNGWAAKWMALLLGS